MSMASWTYRFNRFIEDIDGLPAVEQAALKEMGVTGKDFLDSFSSQDECAQEVGPSAASAWLTHRSVAGMSPDLKRKFEELWNQQKTIAAPILVRSKPKARLYPSSSSGLRIFESPTTTTNTQLAISSMGVAVDDAMQSIFDIYLETGESGSKWLAAPKQGEERRRKVIIAPLQRRFDISQLKNQLGFMKRWRKWSSDETPPICATNPTPLDSASFLQAHSEGKPTVALNLFNHMKWWSKHVGVPFHCEHTAVMAFGVVAPGHVVVPKTPIDLQAMLRLVKVSQMGTGTVHILLRACLMLTVSVVRFKHANISRRVKTTDRMITWFCPKGKRVVAGQQAPFEWAMPRFLNPAVDMAGPLLTILDQIESITKQPVTFVVPDVVGPKSADICNTTPWAPRAMPYDRWLSVLQAMPGMLGFEQDEIKQLWTTYTFRRLLPTIADVIRLHEEHRQALGEWTEQVSAAGSSSARAQPLMCHRYADNKVVTAGETKLLVASAITFMAKNFPQAKTWEDLRSSKVTVTDLDEFISTTPAYNDAREKVCDMSPVKMIPEGSLESDSSSTSSESEASADEDQAISLDQVEPEWFVQPGRKARVHFQHSIDSEGKRLPFCRPYKAFFRIAETSGTGLKSAATQEGGVCDTCLGQLPKATANAVLQAIFAAAEPTAIKDCEQ